MANRTDDDDKLNSLDKMLSILNAFDEEHLTVDMARASQLSGSSRASTYRYLQSLTRSGLLSPAAGGQYVIGSRVIELEMLKRENDPLLRVGRNLIRFFADCTGVNVMLCSYYGDKVLCADYASRDETIPDRYRPGRSMPLFRGAMAKVILAHLSQAQIRAIYGRNSVEIAEAGLGETPEDFLDRLAEIRAAGVIVTDAEVFDGLTGIACPIRDAEGQVLGSVVFVLASEVHNEERITALIEEIRDLAVAVEDGIRRLVRFSDTLTPVAARPSRAPVHRD